MGDPAVSTIRIEPFEISQSQLDRRIEAVKHAQHLLIKWNASNFNDWPQAQVVDFDFVDTHEQLLFSMAMDVGLFGIHHSVRLADVPLVALRHMELPDPSNYSRHTNAWFVPTVAAGTGLTNRGDRLTAYVFLGERIGRFTLGCDHSMEITVLGRAWHKHECPKCGFAFEVDSSG